MMKYKFHLFIEYRYEGTEYLWAGANLDDGLEAVCEHCNGWGQQMENPDPKISLWELDKEGEFVRFYELKMYDKSHADKYDRWNINKALPLEWVLIPR